MFEPEEHAKGRCEGCKHRKRVYAQGDYSFYGCYCSPYTGKRVSEIENCPKKPEREEYIESCAEYKEIGTVEECREARARQTAQPPTITAHRYVCPRCRTSRNINQKYAFCPNCGQRLAWEQLKQKA